MNILCRHLFAGDLSYMVLDYIKVLGKPQDIKYGKDGKYYTATLFYDNDILGNCAPMFLPELEQGNERCW